MNGPGLPDPDKPPAADKQAVPRHAHEQTLPAPAAAHDQTLPAPPETDLTASPTHPGRNPTITPPGPLERTLADALPDTAATISTATAGGGHARDEKSGAPQVIEPALSGPGLRFTLAAPLGRGATSQVWAAHDHDFDREVAIKHLAAAPGAAGSRGRFIHEARLTASLDHPNIVPVYDLGAAADGGLYLVMRRISGRSLGDRIRAAIDAGQGEIAPANAVVTIFLKLCDALGFAHAKGVLHRDIKPDNIMLGEFGEVMMVDWGTASEQAPDSGFRSLVGTPAYMSPEQARGAQAGEPGDVYSLGASLFHALLLRHPLLPGGIPEEFWTRKREGALDAPTPAERKRVPLHLLAIVLKAMAADPAARYPTIAAFAADLQRWQAGLAVTAVKDSWFVRFGRWHRRRARVIYSALVAVVLLIALGVYAYGQRLEEIASWGRPVIAEDFADDSWITRWTPTKAGSFAVKNGALVSRGERESFLICNRRFSGSVAIEFDGQIPPGSKPCDLSVVWTDVDCFATNPPLLSTPNCRMVFLQTGANDNMRAMIMTEPQQVRLSSTRMRLETGRTYHIRAVIDGTHLELIIDGQTVCSYDDIFPYTSGYLALYAYYPGKSFANLRIYNKGVAQKVPALAIGDAFYQEGSYAAAAAAYQHLIDSLPGTAQADQARFRLGMSRMVQGRWDLAQAAWRLVQDPALRLQIRVHGLDHAVKVQDFVALKLDFLALYNDHPDMRALLRTRWLDWVGHLNREHYRTMLPMLEIAQQAFPDDPDTNEIAEGAYDRLGRWQEAAKIFANDDYAEAQALFGAGRFSELAQRFPDNHIMHFMALFDAGAFAEAAEGPGSAVEAESRQYTWADRDLLLCTHRIDDYVKRFGWENRLRLMVGDTGPIFTDPQPEQFSERVVARVQQGRLDDALALARAAKPNTGFDMAANMYVLLGRSAEALPEVTELYNEHTVRTGIALDRLIAGDAAAARTQTAILASLPWSPVWRNIWFEHLIVLPAIARADGDADAVPRALALWGARKDQCEQRSWWFAHAVIGDVSDADFLKQPYRTGATGMLALATAIRLDNAGKTAEAVAAYHVFQHLPPWECGIDGEGWLGDPLMFRFVTWRLMVLDPVGGDRGSATAPLPALSSSIAAPAP